MRITGVMGGALPFVAVLSAGCYESSFCAEDFISDSCIGDSDRVWYFSNSFSSDELAEIADAIDTVNDIFNADIQVCGIIGGTKATGTIRDGKYSVSGLEYSGFICTEAPYHCWYLDDYQDPGIRVFQRDYTSSGDTTGYCQYSAGGDIILNTQNIRNERHFRKVILHEIGHYLGFRGHLDDPDNIMAQGWSGVSEYTQADIDGISNSM
jgi:hypothetical protein